MSNAKNTSRWRSLRKFLAELGILDSILYLLQRLLSRLPGSPQLLKYYLMAQPVPAVTASTGDSSYRFTRVERDAYQADWFPRPLPIIEARFEQDATCLVAYQGSNAVACLWYATGAFDEDVVRCQFVPEPAASCAWDFDVYVHPRHRLTRVFSLLWNYAFTQMRCENIVWSLSRIDAFNLQSVRAHQRLGARRTGSVLFIKIGQFQLTIPTPGKIHASRSAQPLITVRAPKIHTADGC